MNFTVRIFGPYCKAESAKRHLVRLVDIKTSAEERPLPVHACQTWLQQHVMVVLTAAMSCRMHQQLTRHPAVHSGSSTA